MSARSHTLLFVACLAVLAAAVGATPVGATAAADGYAVDAADAGDHTVGDAASYPLAQSDDGGPNATFERDGAEVVVSVPASSFEGNVTNPLATFSLVNYNGTSKAEGDREGDRYVFRTRLPGLVDDAPVNTSEVSVRLSTAGGDVTGSVDARYLGFTDRVTVNDGSFGFVVRSIGFENGPVPMRVAPQNGSGSAAFDATLRIDSGTARLWVDPSSFADSVSPVRPLRFTAFPDTGVVETSWSTDLTNHATAGAATFATDGDRARVGHPLLFARTEYTVVAETTDPQGRYVRRTTARRSGGIGTVSVPGSVTAARSVNVTVLSGGTVVFRGAAPTTPDPAVNATWENASDSDAGRVRFEFAGGLPGRIRTVWLSYDERVWSVSRDLRSDGTNLTVSGDAFPDTGHYGLLVVGGDGSVVRGGAEVKPSEQSPTSTENDSSGLFGLGAGPDSGSGSGSASGSDSPPYLEGAGAFLLGALLTLFGVNAGRGWVRSAAGAAIATTLGLTVWLATMLLLAIYSVPDVHWMLGSVVVGVGVAGSIAGSMDRPFGVPSDVTGPVLVIAATVLAAAGGLLTEIENLSGSLIVAGLGLSGPLVVFLAMELLSTQPPRAGGRTSDVTVELVDDRNGQRVNADLEVTVRSRGGRAGRPSDQRRMTATDGQGVVSLPSGSWEFDPGDRGKTVRESIQQSTRVQVPVDPTDVGFRTRAPDGRPVAGATVSFAANGRERTLATNDDGVVRSELPAGVTEIEATIDHDRYEPVTRTLNTAAGQWAGTTPKLDETLEPLTGGLEAVVTLDGENVPDVEVVAEPGPDVVGDTERTSTDGAGRAAFDALPIGEYTLGVDLSDAAGEFTAPTATVTVSEGETRTEGLPVRFDYRLSGETPRRIDEIRDRLGAVTSHPRSDMSIPAFYASVVGELLRTVERVPEEGTAFLAAGTSPGEAVDALLAAAETGVDAVDEAMSDKQNVDLFAACADMEPANSTWDGSFSLPELFELAELRPGERRGRVAERLDTVNDRISDELRGLSEVGPARSAWERTRDLASDRSREGLEAAAVTMLAEGLLAAIEALFEREALRERMTRTVF